MNYEDLEIWKIANELVLQIQQLPSMIFQNLKCLKPEAKSEDQ
jgi:hypothetical protein